MKKILNIFLVAVLCIQLNAQWETAQLSEVPSQTGTAEYAKGVVDANNRSFLVWENNIGNLYFASRDVGGNWSNPELISENVQAESATIASSGGNTFVAYMKNNGSDTELWLAQLAAPFSIISNEIVMGDNEPKTSLDIGVDGNGFAHLAWAMKDVAEDVVRVHYFNNSESGQLLGSLKVPFTDMKQDYNDVSLSVNADGIAEIAYVGGYVISGEQIIQRAFNGEMNSTNWSYGTYFTFGPSTFTSLKSTSDENLINYASQKANGEITFFQAHKQMTDAWIPDGGNATVIANDGTLESIMVSSSINRHCSIIGTGSELIYAYNTSDSDWTTDVLLNNGAYKSGNLAMDNVGEFYWLGVKDGKAVIYGPETTTGNETLLDYGIKLYPNPASDIVYIEAQNPKNYTIDIFNIQGKLVEQSEFVKKWQTNLTSWQRGIYFVQVRFGNKTISQKLVVN